MKNNVRCIMFVVLLLLVIQSFSVNAEDNDTTTTIGDKPDPLKSPSEFMDENMNSILMIAGLVLLLIIIKKGLMDNGIY